MLVREMPIGSINLTEDVIPLSEFRSTIADCFARTRKTHRPLLVTQNGRASSVVLDVSDFQKMRESFEIWDDLRTAEAELDADRGIPHAQVMGELDDELQDLREEMGL